LQPIVSAFDSCSVLDSRNLSKSLSRDIALVAFSEVAPALLTSDYRNQWSVSFSQLSAADNTPHDLRVATSDCVLRDLVARAASYYVNDALRAEKNRVVDSAARIPFRARLSRPSCSKKNSASAGEVDEEKDGGEEEETSELEIEAAPRKSKRSKGRKARKGGTGKTGHSPQKQKQKKVK
jgi:hypothetical protein